MVERIMLTQVSVFIVSSEDHRGRSSVGDCYLPATAHVRRWFSAVTRKTQWEAPDDWREEECPPLLPPDDDSDEEELPSNWEVLHDPTTGKPFYVDHERKITQWTRPKAEKKPMRPVSHAPANATTSSAAMARILHASNTSSYSQPRSYLQEASYFQPSHVGTAGEVDLSDSMPALDFAVKKVADKYRLECPHCEGTFFARSVIIFDTQASYVV